MNEKEAFDLDDVCEGLLSMIQDICNALEYRNLDSAASAAQWLLSEIEKARDEEMASEDADEDEETEEDENDE